MRGAKRRAETARYWESTSNALLCDSLRSSQNDDDFEKYWESLYGDLPPVASSEPWNIDYNTWRATDFVYNETDHPTSWTADRVLDYIDSFDFDSSTPMFLKVGGLLIYPRLFIQQAFDIPEYA